MPVIHCPEPHPGQMPILLSKKRHRVVRCGRRFGKTMLGIISTLGDPVAGVPGVLTHQMRVGWFCPEYKYLYDTWEELKRWLDHMIVKRDDSKMRLVLDNGSVIEGWTLDNINAGRSRKYNLIIVDEAGLYMHLRQWWSASARATLVDYRGRALLLGTPHQLGPDFDNFFEDAESGAEPAWGAYTAATFDNPYLPRAELREIRADRKRMPLWLWKQEFEAIPCDEATGFFGRAMVRELKMLARPPIWQGRIDIPEGPKRDMLIERGTVDAIELTDEPGTGQWSLWFDPLDGLDQDHGYVMGCDIGAGVGASNTSFSVFNVDTGQKIAEFASPRVGAETAARLACIAGHWFGGRFNGAARICPEVNGGQGQVFAKMLLDLRYPSIFSMREASDGYAQRRFDDIKSSEEIGFTSTHKTKEPMLTDYRAALKCGAFVNPSSAAVAELATYMYDKRGSLVSVRQSRDDPAADIARIPHGDRVIADGLAWHAATHANPAPAPTTPEHDPSSLQYRAKQRTQKPKRGFRMA